MRVAASIVAYRQVEPGLQRAVDAIRAQTHPVEPVRVHLNEGTLGQLAGITGAEVSASDANLGFSGGHNLLLRELFEDGADAVVVHNPDLVLDPDAVHRLVTAGVAQPALLGPALEQADAELRPQGRVDTLGIVWSRSGRHFDDRQGTLWTADAGAPIRVAGISGACLLVTREAHQALVAVGGEFFDEAFVAYREDAELAFRAALLGVPSVLVPAATGLHVRHQRGTSRGRSAQVDLLGVRNRFLLAAKYGRRRPGGLFAPLARDAVVLVGVLLRERSSWAGVVEAWRLRSQMRAKGRRVLAAARLSSREAARL